MREGRGAKTGTKAQTTMIDRKAKKMKAVVDLELRFLAIAKYFEVDDLRVSQ